MDQHGQQTINARVRVRARPRPAPPALPAIENRSERPSNFVQNPAGYDLTDGIYWKHHGKVRVLGRISPGATFSAYVAMDDSGKGGFLHVGDVDSSHDACELIKKHRPLSSETSQPVRKGKRSPD